MNIVINTTKLAAIFDYLTLKWNQPRSNHIIVVTYWINHIYQIIIEYIYLLNVKAYGSFDAIKSPNRLQFIRSH